MIFPAIRTRSNCAAALSGYAYNLKELENDNTPEDLKAALIALLGLESGADDKDIIEAVKMALEGKGTPEEAVDENNYKRIY